MFIPRRLGGALALPGVAAATFTARRTLATMATAAASSSSSPSSTSNPPSNTPVEDIIREKITSTFHPTTLEIHNDSHLHAHHAAMRGATSRETHFRLVVASEAFRGRPQPARHRMVYALLKEEMAREGGVHALQLRTMTPEEEERQREREKEKETA